MTDNTGGPTDMETLTLPDEVRDRLRVIHYPVHEYLGYFSHDWLRSERRVVERFRTDEGILRWIEDQLPEHVPDDRWPDSCADVCGDVELEGPQCSFCGAGITEDGQWAGRLWPCSTAEILGLDVDAPSCRCRYVERSRGVHDPDCAYLLHITSA